MAETATVHVVLELGPAVRGALAAREPILRQELAAALLRAFDELGLPATPRVEIVTLADPALFRLRIGQDLLPCAHALVDDHARELGLPDDYRARIANGDETVSGDALHALFVRVCTECIGAQTDRLVTADVLAGYVARHAAAAAVDAHQLAAVLRALLACGISIADGQTIAARLAVDRTAGRSLRTTTEALIALFRPLVLDVEIADDAAAGVLQGLGPAPRIMEQSQLLQDSVEVLQMLRDGMFYELGIRVPPVRAALGDLPAGTFCCRINHRRGRAWRALRADESLVNEAPDQLRERGITPLRAALNPANRQPCSVIAANDSARATSLGLTTWSALGYMVLCMATEIRSRAYAFIDIDEVEASVGELDAVFPGIAAEVTADGLLEHTTAVLRELLADQVSIRDLRRIIDAVMTTEYLYADSSLIVFDDRVQLFTDTRPEMLGRATIAAAQARKRLSRYLTHKHTLGQNTLVVLLLDATSVEEPVARHLAGSDPLERNWLERLCTAIEDETADAAQRPALLTTPPVAMYLRGALRHACPATPILAYDELAPDASIQPLARIDLAALPVLA